MSWSSPGAQATPTAVPTPLSSESVQAADSVGEADPAVVVPLMAAGSEWLLFACVQGYLLNCA